MRKTFGKYFLGLDIGTSSVGWAVTDMNYNLMKFNGKAMWGVRLFDEAETAEERRLHRTARRRNLRRKERIALLQELFSEEMAKKDFGFFMRLRDSGLLSEDKRQHQTDSFFHDEDYMDQDFFEEYPTIYHLRKELMDSCQPHDIRLVYLAIHHIIKHRGHFLYEGTFQDVADISLSEMMEELVSIMEEMLGIRFQCIDMEKTGQILSNDQLGVNGKKKELLQRFDFDKDDRDGKKAVEELAKLLSGGTVELKVLFLDESLADCELPKISLKGTSYDEHEGEFRAILTDRFALIEKAKAIYDWGILQRILGGKKSISEAKVAVYEAHKADLQCLKSFIRECCPRETYKEVFGVPKEKKANYSAYVGSCMVGGKKRIIEKRCTQEEFCDFLKKQALKTASNFDETKYGKLKARIESGAFMEKQKIKDNGVIPFQIHRKELEKILENASTYLPFLQEKDERGVTVSKKILGIMEFRIPYYVGPLNDAHKDKGQKFCWAVRKEGMDGIPVRPWNFDEIIDRAESAESFIRRMTNKCTYLLGEDVLPKDSLYYSSYRVLNELNNLKINGEKISVGLKQRIFTDLFMRERKVKQNRLRRYLQEEGYFGKGDEILITGIDGDFKGSLTAYIDFKEILGKDVFSDSEKAMVEDIIRYILLFGNDKKMLRDKVEGRYGRILDKMQIQKILKKKYSEWGNFSKELLTEICAVEESTGEYVSILSAMYHREGNPNFMELMANSEPYAGLIKSYNGEAATDERNISYDDLEDLHLSAPVKRAVWQTILIVKELVKILGREPERIFIEVARGENVEKKRTVSRKGQLLELYKSCKNEEPELYESLQLEPEERLRRDKLFLYYIQLGKSMYSGKTIDLDDLEKCDIDHIYPQSKVMDDSLDNRVLVFKNENAAKKDKYPLDPVIQDNMTPFWNMLQKKDFISKTKYERLVRRTGFTLEEQVGFVSRQLVETQQSTKAVAGMFCKMFPQTDVVYSKARNVTAFRQGVDDFELGHRKDESDGRVIANQFIKVRELNDFHHAKDAYLNIVVGNVFYCKFTANPRNFFREKGPDTPYSLNAMYKFKIERNGIVAWQPTIDGTDGAMATVKRTMGKNNVLVTKMAREGSGALFDLNVLKKGKGQVSQKGHGPLTSIENYGGYNKATVAYFFIVEHTGKKGKRCRTIEAVPLHMQASIGSQADLRTYCIEKLGLKEPRILLEKILIGSLLMQNGFRMYLNGKSGKQYTICNANQLILDGGQTVYLKKVLKYWQRTKGEAEREPSTFDGITAEENLQLYDCFQEKLEKTVYHEKLSAQVKSLKMGREKFIELGAGKQCGVLAEILHFFQCNSANSDLRLIDGVKNAGSLNIGQDITKTENLYLIHQSVTG
ncbi:MAG: type II CRISPR RNA-guided endonuclease Cas9, partial [Firmicutes bacterium]|nr:type II CRISPR RNA-guided endonuclease Cas9 [Bacillota bacterium]